MIAVRYCVLKTDGDDDASVGDVDDFTSVTSNFYESLKLDAAAASVVYEVTTVTKVNDTSSSFFSGAVLF